MACPAKSRRATHLCLLSFHAEDVQGIRKEIKTVSDQFRCFAAILVSDIFCSKVNSLKVSRHWQAIAMEVEEDMRLRQIMWEEVMLMQVRCRLPTFTNDLCAKCIIFQTFTA